MMIVDEHNETRRWEVFLMAPVYTTVVEAGSEQEAIEKVQNSTAGVHALGLYVEEPVLSWAAEEIEREEVICTECEYIWFTYDADNEPCPECGAL